jgi:hypothetical protein
MTATRTLRPQVEHLEERTVLSAMYRLALAAPILSAAHTHHPRHHHHHTGLALSGQVSGTWQAVFTNPDVGRTQNLAGGGTVAPLGTMEVRGQLHTPGFVAQGRATATLTLTGSRGSVTLALVGPLQPGFSAPPSSFQYTITGSTGAYANASGSGTVALSEQQNPPLVCPPNALCAPLLNGGTFTLTFQPSA